MTSGCGDGDGDDDGGSCNVMAVMALAVAVVAPTYVPSMSTAQLSSARACISRMRRRERYERYTD